MSGAALRRRARCRQLGNGTKGEGVKVRLGVDIACRSPHVAACADESGSVLWSGRRFRTEASELEVLWARLPVEAAEVMVVMEPARNAWVPLVGWFRRRGARVVLVPSEQSSDLRDYFSKHTKTGWMPSCSPAFRSSTLRGSTSPRRSVPVIPSSG